MARSLRVHPNQIERVKLSVRRNGYLTQRSLSETLGLALSTVSNFLTGKPVDRAVFVDLCAHLSLEWQDIAETESFSEPVDVVQSPAVAVGENIQPLSRYDWKEAPDISAFVGRNQELDCLHEWIVRDQCHLIALLGLGGVGKTTLTVKLAEQAQSEFKFLMWRSLRNTPPIHTLLTELISFLSDQQAVEQFDRIEEQISYLMNYLRQQRCLLVLDNFESIVQGGDRAGQYLESYEGYGQLLRRISDERHQSCVIITSREKPVGINLREDKQGLVRSYYVSGLSEIDAHAILGAAGLNITANQQQLITQYKGNPLALKIVASTIQSVFGGDSTEFLQQGTPVFGDIWDLLDQQFNRLTELQQQIMYWLAINRDRVTIVQLREDLVYALSSHELIGAITKLRERSLIEATIEGFTQQPAVMGFVTARFIDRVCEEIVTQTLKLFQSHALLKTDVADYVYEAQIQLMLKPLIDRLLNRFGSKSALEKHLKQMVQVQQQTAPLHQGYVAGNLINLLSQLEIDLTDYDFSNLHIRQAYLVGIPLHHVNFTGCDFARSIFSETLTATLSVAFSPDGRLFATGNADNIVRIWQTKDSSRLVTCKGHSSWVWAVAFSPDGRSIVTSSFDQTIRLWDTDTGVLLKTLSGHTDWVWAVTFSPDGQRLASASNDHTVKLWDVASGQCVATLDQHTSTVNSVVFSPNGQLIASSSNDRTIKLWNSQTGELLTSLGAHMGWIRSITFSPDGKTLISGSHDQTIKVWDLATWQCLRTLHGHSSYVLSIALSSDGCTLASGSTDSTVRVWNIHTGDCLKVLQGHPNGVWSVAFHPNGWRLVSGSNDSMVKVWDVKTGQSLKTLQGYCTGVRSLKFSPNGQQLLSGGDDKIVRLWDIKSATLSLTLQGHTSWVWSVAFSPNHLIVASSGYDSTIRLWNSETGKEICTLQEHTNLVLSIAFNPQGQTLVSGSVDQTIRVWDLESRACIRTISTHDRIWSVAFSPDGQVIASGNENGVTLWRVQSGERIGELAGHRAIVFAIAFSPDGTLVATGSSDQTVKLWNWQTGDTLFTFSHSSRVWGVAFSPDGMLASASEDQTVNVWNVQTGECVRSLRNPTSGAWSVAFSSDGQLLVTGGQNGIIYLWNMQTGQLIKTISNKRLYEQMKLDRVTGLTLAQQDSLEALGASIN